jgi:hypothetical protein
MKTYSKPDVAVLGDAALLIQSSKPSYGENGQAMQPNAALDDAD